MTRFGFDQSSQRVATEHMANRVLTLSLQVSVATRSFRNTVLSTVTAHRVHTLEVFLKCISDGVRCSRSAAVAHQGEACSGCEIVGSNMWSTSWVRFHKRHIMQGMVSGHQNPTTSVHTFFFQDIKLLLFPCGQLLRSIDASAMINW